MRAFYFSAVMNLVAVSAMAQAQSHNEVGRIEELHTPAGDGIVLKSEAHIVHENGTSEALRARINILYPGDLIVVTANRITVDYSLIGYKDKITVSHINSPAKIPSVATLKPNKCVIFSCDFVMNIGKKTVWNILPTHTTAHGDELAPVTYSLVLGQSDQLITEGTTSLAVVWTGGKATVMAGDSANTVDQPFATLTSIPTDEHFSVSVKGQDGGLLAWSVKRTSSPPPLPEGVASDADISSDGDRLARAVYLMKPQFAQWHLFAISEIAALRDHSITADILWRQVVNGKLPDQ